MTEKPTKIPFPPGSNTMASAYEVPIVESTERWTEVKLEDGSILRVKPTVMAAARIEGQFDQDGNPMYALRTTQTMMVSSTPEHLRKGGKGRVQ